jgi:hypothetical protein
MQEFIIQNQYTLGIALITFIIVIIFSIKFYKTNKKIKSLLSTVKNIDDFDTEIQKQISRVNNTITELYKELDDKNELIANILIASVDQSELYEKTRVDLLNSIKIQQKANLDLSADTTLFLDKVVNLMPEKYATNFKVTKNK